MCQSVVESIVRELGVDAEEAKIIVSKAEAGGEITESFGPDQWLNERFLPNCIKIDEQGYAKMCIDALKILSTTAATDFGGSRQRDLGQLWADMTRGYLGEYAFLLYLKNRFAIDSELGHEVGDLQEYLPMDIHKVKGPGDVAFRPPRVKIGVKTTKWNGIWFDIPGDQFNHSDVHVLVKVGTGRDHLFAFFKHLSVFRDKVLMEGQRVNSITADEADELYNKLPTMRDVPAYICGFALKTDTFQDLPYVGHTGSKHCTISEWCGPIRSGDLERIRQRENLPSGGKAKFEGIGEFAHDSGYLFNTGSLHWKPDEWRRVIDSL